MSTSSLDSLVVLVCLFVFFSGLLGRKFSEKLISEYGRLHDSKSSGQEASCLVKHTFVM